MVASQRPLSEIYAETSVVECIGIADGDSPGLPASVQEFKA